jgi:hypothetical protein
MTLAEMRELVKNHADLEVKLDLEGVLNTLVDSPIYEFYPARLKLEGKNNVRQFYRDHFDYFFPKIKSHTLINEWWKEDAACLEYDLYLKEPFDSKRAYRILVVLKAKDSLLLGERFYLEDELIRLMTGNSYQLLMKF